MSGEQPKYDFDDLKKSPSTETSKDFKQMVKDAIQDKRLTKEERGEIIKLVNQMDQEKVQAHQETIAELKKFATENGYTGFNGNLEKSLKSAGEKVSNKPADATPASTPQAPTEPAQASTPAAPEAAAEATPAAPDKKEPKQPETSTMDKVGNFFTGKLDLNLLPKDHQAVIKDLQDAGFRLKPIEGKNGEYTVDMNGLFDKSSLKISTPNQLDFKTNTVTQNGKPLEYSFENTTQAKEKMTKINDLANVNAELKPLENIFDTHRSLQEQDQHQKLTAQKATLEKDLGIAPAAPSEVKGEGK